MNVLITGSTSGIGFNTGIRLLNDGNKVYFTVHRSSQVLSLKKKLIDLNINGNYEVFKLDITNKNDLRLIYNYDIDCLFCNSAVGYGGSILDIDINKLEDNFNVNVFSNIKLIRNYISSLIINNKKGRVVVMSSLAGVIPIPFLGSYCATKSSLITLITCLRKEVKLLKYDVDIKLIEPGIYNTGFNEVMIDDIDNNYRNILLFLFNLFGKNNTNSIVDKINTAITTKSNKFIYSAPFIQYITARIYKIFS